jgi:hypothetical protein
MDSDSDNFDPKTKQKAIYTWYDLKYSDEARDIYSSEWQERIMLWHELATPTTPSSEENLDQLDFGSFFLAHPVPAFALWQVLQACYELDRAVCGNTEIELGEITSWERLAPFNYLGDSTSQLKWQISLKLLERQISDPNFIPSPTKSWVLIMYDILLGVERFESTFESLQENFSFNLPGEKFASWMIARIEEGASRRFLMIDRLLKLSESGLANIRSTAEDPRERLGPPSIQRIA